MDFELKETISDFAPTSTEDVHEPETTQDEIDEVERAVIDLIAQRDIAAKAASLPWRQSMQAALQQYNGQVYSITEPCELGTYYSNFIGRRLSAKVDFQHEQLFPDTIGYSNVVVTAVAKSLIANPENVQTILKERATGRLGALAATARVREGLFQCNFQSFARQLELDCEVMGNSYSSVDYEEILDYGTEEDSGDMEFGDIPLPSKPEPRVLMCGIQPVRVDPRNLFPGSVEQDKGLSGVEWWTQYEVLTWNDIWRSRRVTIDGRTYGCYTGWEKLDPSAASYINRVYYNDLMWDGQAAEPMLLDTNIQAALEKGWGVCRHIGSLGLQDLRTAGHDFKAAQWRAFLKSKGNDDPDAIAATRYFDAKVLMEGNSSTAATGPLIQFRPHWYMDGLECPTIHDRRKVHQGYFFGDSDYSTLSGDEALANIVMRTVISQQVYGAKPAALFDPLAFDADYLKANGGAIRLLPGSLIPTRPMDSFANHKPLDFLRPSESSIADGLSALGFFTNNFDQVTGQTGVQLGQSMDDTTATSIAAAQNNAQVSIRASATERETCMVLPMMRMILSAVQTLGSQTGLDYQVESLGDAERLRGASPEIDAALDLMESKKIDRQQAAMLFPMPVTVLPDVFGGDFKIDVLVSSSIGGRTGYKVAMEEHFKRESELNVVFPNQTDLKGMSNEIARIAGIPDPERWRNTPEEVDRALGLQVLAQEMQGATAGGSPSARPVGAASAPKDTKQYDPVEAVGP